MGKMAIRLLWLIIIQVTLAGCVQLDGLGLSTTNQPNQEHGKLVLPSVSTGEIVNRQCHKDFISTRKNILVAERTVPGDTHYIEFRLRHSPVLPSGHMYVVYGKLDTEGMPQSFNYTGLFPKGSVVGLYTGTILPIPMSAELEPSILDCNFRPISAYRRSISAAQYDKLLTKVAEYKSNPPKWVMYSFNCNHYAASLGETVGMTSPTGRRSLQFLSIIYFRQFVLANGDKIS